MTTEVSAESTVAERHLSTLQSIFTSLDTDNSRSLSLVELAAPHAALSQEQREAIAFARQNFEDLSKVAVDKLPPFLRRYEEYGTHSVRPASEVARRLILDVIPDNEISFLDVRSAVQILRNDSIEDQIAQAREKETSERWNLVAASAVGVGIMVGGAYIGSIYVAGFGAFVTGASVADAYFAFTNKGTRMLEEEIAARRQMLSSMELDVPEVHLLQDRSLFSPPAEHAGRTACGQDPPEPQPDAASAEATEPTTPPAPSQTLRWLPEGPPVIQEFLRRSTRLPETGLPESPLRPYDRLPQPSLFNLPAHPAGRTLQN